MNAERKAPDVFSIRDAREGDTDDIVRLWKDLMSFHEELDDRFAQGEGSEVAWRAYLHDLLTGPESFVYVAEVGSEIVGFLSGSINEGPPVLRVRRFGWVSDAHVDEGYRRQGIGEELLLRAKEWFSEREISAIQLNVSPVNAVAESFWRKMGFRDHLERLWLDLT